jgi:ribonuclease HII
LSKIIIEKINYLNFSPHPIVGVDEVGRGCLAGPVYAAAVCLRTDSDSEYFTDSKLLSEKRREFIAPIVLSNHYVGMGSATVEEIDELNILQASLLAMRRAIEDVEKKMGQKSGNILVYGNQNIPNFDRKQTTIIKGDLRCAPISAASIVAKVARDSLMKEYSNKWSEYGFEKHKGYGSEVHRKVIQEIGPCECHRKSFRGVKEFLSHRP